MTLNEPYCMIYTVWKDEHRKSLKLVKAEAYQDRCKSKSVENVSHCFTNERNNGISPKKLRA